MRCLPQKDRSVYVLKFTMLDVHNCILFLCCSETNWKSKVAQLFYGPVWDCISENQKHFWINKKIINEKKIAKKWKWFWENISSASSYKSLFAKLKSALGLSEAISNRPYMSTNEHQIWVDMNVGPSSIQAHYFPTKEMPTESINWTTTEESICEYIPKAENLKASTHTNSQNIYKLYKQFTIHHWPNSFNILVIWPEAIDWSTSNKHFAQPTPPKSSGAYLWHDIMHPQWSGCIRKPNISLFQKIFMIKRRHKSFKSLCESTSNRICIDSQTDVGNKMEK